MKVWRLIVTGLMVLAVAACSASTGAAATKASPAPRPPATIAADPVVAIAAAKARLGTESARFGVDGGSGLIGFTGTVNVTTKNWEIVGNGFVVRRVGTGVYVQASGATLQRLVVSPASRARLAAGGWVHTQVPPGWGATDLVFSEAFPWNLANPATSATGFTRTGSRAFSGTITTQDTIPSSKPRPDTHLRVGVDLDQQGRFSAITLDSKGADHTAFTFADYGAPADISAPPTADVAEEDEPEFLVDLALI